MSALIPTVSVTVIDRNGHTLTFPSMRAASKALSIPYPTFRRGKCEGATRIHGMAITFG